MKRLVRYFLLVLGNPSLRLGFVTFVGVVFNLAYVAFDLSLGILYKNAWFVTVAGFYLFIVSLRFRVLGMERVRDEGARASILAIFIPMTGMMLYTAFLGEQREYPAFALTVFLVYAFVGVLRAIIGLFIIRPGARARLSHSIRLTLALLSIFNLQTACFSFINVDPSLQRSLLALTASAVSLSMLAICRCEEGKGI